MCYYCKYDHLMCYYHLIAKVIDRLEGLPYELRNSVLRDTYDLHYSRSADEFTTDCESTETRWLKTPILTARFEVSGFYENIVAPRISLDFLMMNSCTGVLHVLYTAPKRAYNPATNSMQEALQVSAQVGVNTARKEADNQPRQGGRPDLPLLLPLQVWRLRAGVDGNGEEVLANRRVPKRKRTAVGIAPSLPNAAGRPPLVGHALQRE
ncbi:hypothetical protein GQ600_6672 [Phytophthora cactorum]|nr:hypothetical protein GQ600_6672 [Phytophthora cactorum]